MNRTSSRLHDLFNRKQRGILSVYFCAGHPTLNSTLPILEALQQGGIDMVEVGIPFSDPLADGPVIQHAANTSLQQGMTLSRLFEQLTQMRPKIKIPVILMGYLNPILHYGIEAFCAKCKEVGIDGLIIPDLPFEQFKEEMAEITTHHQLPLIFLITPETPEDRIRAIDEYAEGFIYAVSSASVTGAQASFDERREAYFRRLAHYQLQNPFLVGFGISNRATRSVADAHSAGVIVGSKFVTLLEQEPSTEEAVKALLKALNE